MKGRKVYVVGVGMTKFEKPGRRDNFDYPDMAKEAITKALMDASLTYDVVEQAVVGYCYGDSTCGQRALYQVGMTQIPILNVNNNCSTGSTALFAARQSIAGGIYECTLALGFEKMAPGSLQTVFKDRTPPMKKFNNVMREKRGIDKKAPGAAQMFGNAGVEHMEKYGTNERHFAKIGAKNHQHSKLNPYSQFRDVYTVDEVQNARKVFKYLTLLQCCPTSDGAGAAILASEDFVKKHNLQGLAVEIVSQHMATDSPNAFSGSSIQLIGFDMTKRASEQVYKDAGIQPKDVQVVELHDCFSANELVTYEALGLCDIGKAGEMIDKGDNTFGGQYVVNPSGGLISKGHPLGATGLAQCCELVWQTRGWCGERQVQNVKYALQHNVGLGGAVVVTLYKKGFPQVPTPSPKNFGYNPAIEAREITDEDFHKIQPQNSSLVSSVAVSFSNPISVPGFKSSTILEKMRIGVEALSEESKKDYIKQVDAIFVFEITNNEGKVETWTLDLKNGAGSMTHGSSTSDVKIAISDQDLIDLLEDNLNGQAALYSGRIKITGDIMKATKLDLIFKVATQTKSKL